MTELNIYFIISTQTIQVNNADTTKLLHCHYCWFTTKFWGFFFIALRISYFGKDNLTLECIMSQTGQAHLKNLAANTARFLKCVSKFWDIMH